MDLVNLVYRYINKCINSQELLTELKNIDLTKYSKTEIKIINKLIIDVQNIINTTPNEIDEVEANRISKTNEMLKFFCEAKDSDKADEQAKEFIKKQYNKLLEDKKRVRDGGKLYQDIFQLMTKNSLVNKYAKKMNDLELLEFITKYISLPTPPEINQDAFNDLVIAGIKEDKRESLWRLAFNYNDKNKNFYMIEDYFIEKKDAYYLTELMCSVETDLDIDGIIKKVLFTKNDEFINEFTKLLREIHIMTDEDIDKYGL